MRWWLRGGIVGVGMLILFLASPVMEIHSGDSTLKRIHYVALGDSITDGYGLEHPEKDSYVSLVRTYLEERYDEVSFFNFGENGLQSGELLSILTDPSNKKYKSYISTLHYADVITVSIGSNDLLHLLRLDMDIQDYVEHGDSIFREACTEFRRNFPRIIRKIRKIAPSAIIYVNNVYNPCHGLEEYKDLYQAAEHYIDLLNTVYTDNLSKNSFSLVDVKKEFDISKDKLVNMALNGRELDPHPTKVGHARIGQAVIQKISMTKRGINR